jgi:hypothetical protein
VTRDYYGEARALGADLWEAGFKEWADKIESVIQSGSTATEILMGIRWTLGQMTSSESGLPASLFRRAVDLEQGIAGALR